MGYRGRPIGNIIPYPKTRGEHMHNARLRARMSQDKLAKLSGVSATTIGCVETDKVVPHLDIVELLADALGLSIDEYTGHETRRR